MPSDLLLFAPEDLMRVFALSGVPMRYEVNLRWRKRISLPVYSDELLIIPGDVSRRQLLRASRLDSLARRLNWAG